MLQPLRSLDARLLQLSGSLDLDMERPLVSNLVAPQSASTESESRFLNGCRRTRIRLTGILTAERQVEASLHPELGDAVPGTMREMP